ncbi:hypothetical protein PSTG_19729, partial [Puccinia striiformis f. sp. tritici PST-78]
SVNAAVRTNATKALVTTKLCIGADISNFLQDLNPQLLTTIEGEFAKIDGERPPTPTRQSADVAQASQGETSGAKGKGKNFSKHKNPAVKEQTMKFLVRCLRNTIHAIPKAELKSLSDVMLSGLEDAVVPVREVAAEGLGTLMKL